MRRSTICCLLAVFAFAGAQAALVERLVTYQHEDVVLEGFHVYDDTVTGKRPAVLVIHQWTGLSDYEKRRSRMLAELGYNVMAADVYGKGVRPQAPAEAAPQAAKFKSDRALFRDRLLAAVRVLENEQHTHPGKIAALGYCFGGTGALELARAGAPLAGVVSFHGGLDALPGWTAKPDAVTAKVLVLHGAADPLVPAKDIEAFTREMTAANADWQMVFYGHAVHAFTQPGGDVTKGVAHHPDADRRSWEAMKSFLAEIFK